MADVPIISSKCRYTRTLSQSHVAMHDNIAVDGGRVARFHRQNNAHAAGRFIRITVICWLRSKEKGMSIMVEIAPAYFKARVPWTAHLLRYHKRWDVVIGCFDCTSFHNKEMTPFNYIIDVACAHRWINGNHLTGLKLINIRNIMKLTKLIQTAITTIVCGSSRNISIFEINRVSS